MAGQTKNLHITLEVHHRSNLGHCERTCTKDQDFLKYKKTEAEIEYLT